MSTSTNSINIYTNDSQESIKLKNKLTIFFYKAKITINEKSSNVLVLGGDGTFIKAFNKYRMKNVKLLLINTGGIGFYSSFDNIFSIDKILNFFSDENNFYNPNIIKCEINSKSYYAINEIFINSPSVIKTNISINDCKYETFVGSGLSFCTITGSTGWNKSFGGSIFITRNKLWQMVEIAPVNNIKNLTIRNPIILDIKNYINLHNIKSNKINLSCDGINHMINDCKTIKLFLTVARAKIAVKNLNEYFTKLHNIFIKE